jgi:hypothetical protein
MRTTEMKAAMEGPINASAGKSHAARPAGCRERARQTATGGVTTSSTEIIRISNGMTVFTMSRQSGAKMSE